MWPRPVWQAAIEYRDKLASLNVEEKKIEMLNKTIARVQRRHTKLQTK